MTSWRMSPYAISNIAYVLANLRLHISKELTVKSHRHLTFKWYCRSLFRHVSVTLFAHFIKCPQKELILYIKNTCHLV